MPYNLKTILPDILTRITDLGRINPGVERVSCFVYEYCGATPAKIQM